MARGLAIRHIANVLYLAKHIFRFLCSLPQQIAGPLERAMRLPGHLTVLFPAFEIRMKIKHPIRNTPDPSMDRNKLINEFGHRPVLPNHVKFGPIRVAGDILGTVFGHDQNVMLAISTCASLPIRDRQHRLHRNHHARFQNCVDILTQLQPGLAPVVMAKHAK